MKTLTDLYKEKFKDHREIITPSKKRKRHKITDEHKKVIRPKKDRYRFRLIIKFKDNDRWISMPSLETIQTVNGKWVIDEWLGLDSLVDYCIKNKDKFSYAYIMMNINPKPFGHDKSYNYPVYANSFGTPKNTYKGQPLIKLTFKNKEFICSDGQKIKHNYVDLNENLFKQIIKYENTFKKKSRSI